MGDEGHKRRVPDLGTDRPCARLDGVSGDKLITRDALGVAGQQVEPLQVKTVDNRSPEESRRDRSIALKSRIAGEKGQGGAKKVGKGQLAKAAG